MKPRSMGSHHRGYKGRTNEWLTPPEIIKALGPFDLDPCSPAKRPWSTAKMHYALKDDGLSKPWDGFVWMNPPYGPDTWKWLKKLADHGNGIALIFARTETDMFFRFVWNRANAALFLKGRIHFHDLSGERAKANSGAPSVLVGYGERAFKTLSYKPLPGHFVRID